MTKIYQIISIVSLIAALVFGIMYNYQSSQTDKYKSKWQESEAKVENLQERVNANMAANKHKAELEKKISNSKDIDNLDHIPDADILEQLRSDPV